MHHDDFGGLHRDLRSIGALMTRRRFVRLALGASLLPMLPWDGRASEKDAATVPASPKSPQDHFREGARRVPRSFRGRESSGATFARASET